MFHCSSIQLCDFPNTTMYIKLLLIVSLAVYSKADPYDNVGKCDKDILTKGHASFNINEIADTGDYTYLYSIGLNDVECAKAKIYKKNDGTYGGSATITLKDKAPYTTSYDVSNVGKGVITEVLNQNGETYYFYLIVLHWDKDNKVFHYARCSEFGKDNIIRKSIVVHDTKNAYAVEEARIWWKTYDNGLTELKLSC